MIVLLDVKRIVAVEVLLATWTVDGVDEATGEGCLVEECVVGAEKVVSVSYGAMMVDLHCLFALVGGDAEANKVNGLIG